MDENPYEAPKPVDKPIVRPSGSWGEWLEEHQMMVILLLGVALTGWKTAECLYEGHRPAALVFGVGFVLGIAALAQTYYRRRKPAAK